MKILISNDDGIHACGIKTLASALRAAGHEVVVVAPDRNRSAASSCLTLVDPLRVHQISETEYTVVAGTPADCVHLALNGMLDIEFDLVVSGINHGANLGDDVVYSGTLAAAIEGRHLPYPSIAVSLVGKTHFDTCARVVCELLAKLPQGLLPARQVLNVNVPDVPYAELQGRQITRLGYRSPAAEVVRTQDPRGDTVHWIGVSGAPVDDVRGTDFYAVAHGFVSITPIHVDMTAYASLNALEDWSVSL